MDIIIETPKGSRQKYSFDKDTKLFRLKKVLAPGLVFPFDFGFIPGTKGEDGDPLDMMVISEYQGFPGCIMDVAYGRLFTGHANNRKEELPQRPVYWYT